jgi:hypothetical protein
MTSLASCQPAFPAARETDPTPPLPRRSKPRGSAITRSDAFVLIIAKPSAYPPFPQRGKQAVPLRPSLVFLAEGSAITRSDAFALVVAKLGFNPLSSAGRETGRFPPAMRQGCRIGRVPCPLASRIKALVLARRSHG